MQASCCIVGGGPAGMMLGLLLARSGIDVVVLEKHADFLRDFRGDTVHPSTLDVMGDLGLLDEFLRLPHQRVTQLCGRVGDRVVRVADFSRLRASHPFLAFMPQWEFLTFIAERAAGFPSFHLVMQAQAQDLLWDGTRVAGVRAQTPRGELIVRAGLTVACDGRDSVMRDRANLRVREVGAPMDVLWLRFSKRPEDSHETFGYVRDGRILALIDRGAFWQCAYVIAKGTFADVRARGLGALREQVARTAPLLADRTAELRSWDDVKLLTVRVERLKRWYRDGLLCIGDAAHAMSPIGGAGINLAVQDAVAAANRLAPRLVCGRVCACDLRAVQRRRQWPAIVTQGAQAWIARAVIGRVLGAGSSPLLHGLPMVAAGLPVVSRALGRLVAYGLRPERVRELR